MNAKLTKNSNGTISYVSTHQIAPVRHSPEPKARKDKPGKTLERIKASIDKAASRHDNPDRCKGLVGRPAAIGFQVHATDGHRALLVPGFGDGPAWANVGDTKGYRLAIVDNPEFHLALKRALVMTDNTPLVRLICKDGILTVKSQCDDGTFDETIHLIATSDWRIALNGTFLEIALGSWPLHVWVNNQNEPLIIEPSDRSWRYVGIPVAVVPRQSQGK